VLWTAIAPRAAAEGCRIRPLTPEECDATVLPTPRGTDDTLLMTRSQEQIRHMLSCPRMPTRLLEMHHPGRGRRGYLLLALAESQTRLVDYWVDSNDPDDWRLLFESAVRASLEHPTAAELVTWASSPVESAVLLQCGFHQRATQPVQVLAPQGVTVPDRPLRVQMLDNDAPCIYGDRPEFWA
jgi:hypothetical protein